MGKLIVFWAPVHGQSKVTSSMSAVSFALGEVTGGSTLLTHTQYGFSALEGLFDFKNGGVRTEIYDGSGLSALVMNFKRSEITTSSVKKSVMLIEPSDNIYLMPGAERNTDANTDMDDILFTLVTKHIKNAYDYVMVDLASGSNKLSERLIKVADVFVVCLSQNMNLWEMTLESAKNFGIKNTFYLVTGYHEGSKYSINNLIRKGSRYGMTKDNTGVVLDNADYMDSVSDGQVSLYYYRNNKVAKKEHNYEFISSCKETARKIQKLAEAGGR